jgi:hypothetical protein
MLNSNVVVELGDVQTVYNSTFVCKECKWTALVTAFTWQLAQTERYS